jgi:predicted DNA-binding WGR domain protein
MNHQDTKDTKKARSLEPICLTAGGLVGILAREMHRHLLRRVYLEYRAGVGRPRFYAARLQAAGEHWLVVRHWGFVGRPGWHMSRAHRTEEDAARELRRLQRRREREGYEPAPARTGAAAALQLAFPMDGPEPAGAALPTAPTTSAPSRP